MKTKLWIIALLALLPTTLWAQDTSQPKEQLYDFDDMLIDGEFRDPEGMYERSRKSTNFDQILELKRSFLPKIKKSEHAKTLEP